MATKKRIKPRTAKPALKDTWLQISEADLADTDEARRALQERARANLEDRNTEYADAFIEAGRKLQVYGEIEVDEASLITHSDDAGEYVLGFLWVENERAGITSEDDPDDEDDDL